MDYANPRLAEQLAAAYVTGTLRGRARRRFETLLAAHPTLRQAVQAWQDRLMPLTSVIGSIEPPSAVWRRIEAQLWPTAASSPAPAAQPWWQRLAPWRGLAGVATVTALSMGLWLANPAPTLPPVVIVLQATPDAAAAVGAGSSFVASVSGDGRSLVTRPLQKVTVQPGRVLELWSVPPDGAPRSLGLISADGSTVLSRDKLPATLLKGGTQALAVSVEPPGGSTTGAPTGPVVYAGKLQL
ncbi:MAG: anti-sigma factor [Rubrivivax sp.]